MPKNWTESTIKVNEGIELFTIRTGVGDKPTLVMAHGLTDSGLCWHQLASDLQADYDLVMYDAYGHGKSSRIDPGKRFDPVEDLHDLIVGLKLDQPGVIGHSMGAAAAAGLAAKYPKGLSCLILEDPPWTNLPFDADAFGKTMQTWKMSNIERKMQTVKDLIQQKKKECPNWEEAILKEWAQAKLDLDPAVFDHYPAENRKWQEVAKAIQVPTLIITGDNARGAIVTPKLGIEALEILSHGEFGHISAAGHCVRYEQYQPYLTMVKLFLKRNMSI